MTASPIAGIAEQANESLGSWQPETPEEFDTGIADLKQLYEELGTALTGLSERLGSDFPVEPRTVEAVAELGATTNGLADAAQEVYQMHRADHEREMQRAEEPRPGEEMWNIKP